MVFCKLCPDDDVPRYSNTQGYLCILALWSIEKTATYISTSIKSSWVVSEESLPKKEFGIGIGKGVCLLSSRLLQKKHKRESE